jgi:hypothetical protein
LPATNFAGDPMAGKIQKGEQFICSPSFFETVATDQPIACCIQYPPRSDRETRTLAIASRVTSNTVAGSIRSWLRAAAAGRPVLPR